MPANNYKPPSIDYEKLAKNLGATLTAAWKTSGLTKVDLAKTLSMSRVSITKILQGNQLPQLPVLYILCDILGLEVAEILPSLKEISVQTEIEVILPDEAIARLPAKTIRAMKGNIEP